MIDFMNGSYRVLYDETFQPGDLITAYEKGYHEFVNYEDRGKKIAPLVFYRRAYNFNGKKCNSKVVLSCDAAFCHRAKDHILQSIKDKEQQIFLLKDIIYPPHD